jgi:hypothetical protein
MLAKPFPQSLVFSASQNHKEKQMKAAIGTCFLTVAAVIALTICPPARVEATHFPQFFHGAPGRRAPGPSALVDGVTNVQYYNWGGYAVTGNKFTDVKGSWIVPTVNCAKSPNA